MRNQRKLLVFLFTLYVVTLNVVIINNQNEEDLRRSFEQGCNYTENTYKFDNPSLAYHILSKLDLYEPIDPTLSQKEIDKKEVFRAFNGLKTDDQYCEKHRAYFVENPEFMFKEKNFVTTFKRGSDLRKYWIPQVGGNDKMPHIHGGMNETISKQSLYDIRPDSQAFFVSSFLRRKINKHFACTTQMLNHIPGHEKFVNKDSMSQLIQKYQAEYESKPHCLDVNKFFPKTYALPDKEQCEEFFKIFNSPVYQELKKERKIVYFRKIGVGTHRGLGVFPVDDKEEIYIRELYQNGAKCGEVKDNNLMQTYIHNPLLMEGRKTDFRFYLLIASTNPLIAYYNDGYFSISLTQFNPNATDKGTVMTNFRLAQEFFTASQQQGMYAGMTDRDMWNDTIWTFERFQHYLLYKGVINDTNWLDNYLRPELMKMTIHIMRMAKSSLLQRSSLFEIFGIDVVMDTDFNLWFIEANTNPDMEEFPEGTDQVVKNFLYDSFETLFALLRSRAKRIVNYVNHLTRNEGNLWAADKEGVQFYDLGKRIAEFKAVSSNYFEPEFEVKPRGEFFKVVDENYSGPERYRSLLSQDCF